MLDPIDLQIIEYLRANGRAQWKVVGESVHLTGQAVADRVHRMEDLGIIEGYTVKLDESRLGNQITALITVYMKHTDHQAFLQFIEQKPEVKEAHRVSGEGCYWLKAVFAETGTLNNFLDQLLAFGNYRINLSIGRIR